MLTQKSFTTYPTTNNYLNGGIDIQFTPKFNAGYDMRMSYTKSKSFASNNIVISKDPLSSFIGQNASDINNSNKTTFLGSNLSAKYKIDTTGSEWTAQVDYNYYGKIFITKPGQIIEVKVLYSELEQESWGNRVAFLQSKITQITFQTTEQPIAGFALTIAGFELIM